MVMFAFKLVFILQAHVWKRVLLIVPIFCDKSNPARSSFLIRYLKTKVFAVKDLWHTYVTNKLPDQDAYEAHRFTAFERLEEENGKVKATVKGWQQVGVESVVYSGKGQRIMLALLGAEEQGKVTVHNTVHDEVTGSDWKKISFDVLADKQLVTANIAALDAFGNSLNQTHCSGYAAIGADHYTAN